MFSFIRTLKLRFLILPKIMNIILSLDFFKKLKKLESITYFIVSKYRFLQLFNTNKKTV